jgi:hypothetical protein
LFADRAGQYSFYILIEKLLDVDEGQSQLSGKSCLEIIFTEIAHPD